MTSPARSSPLLLALASVAAVLVGAEIALRVFAPFPNPYGSLERSQVNQYIRFEYPRHYAAVTEAESGLPGMSGRSRFTTNNMGFRGEDLRQPKPRDEYRVFLVGGSALECFYLDDRDEIGRVMQGAMPALPDGRRACVYNVGLSGAASDDHVALIAQRLVHLEPDLVVVMAGINDLGRTIFGFDYLHYVDPSLARARPWYKRLAMSSQLVRRVHRLKTRMTPDVRTLLESRPLVTDYAARIGLQRTGSPAAEAPRIDERSYATNLRSIAGIARANGFGLVFATQQTTWNSPVDPQAREWSWMRFRDGVTFGEAEMDAAMETLNETTRAVAAEKGLPLFDLAERMPKSLEYFYDDCHLNPAGAEEVGRRLAAFVSGIAGRGEDSSSEDPRVPGGR